MRLLQDVGLLFPLFPALRPLAGLCQNRWHRYDVLEHTIRALEEAELLTAGCPAAGVSAPLAVEDAELLKWAALFHDVGKAGTVSTGTDGEVHFHGHEGVSAAQTTEALTALRMGSRKIGRIGALITFHLRLPLLSSASGVSERALRRLVHRMGYDTPLLCLLAVADRRAGGGADLEGQILRLEALASRVMQIMTTEGETLISPPPLLSGIEVMDALALQPGPRVGAILRWLTRLQVEGRISGRDEALRELERLPAARIMTIED